MNTLPPLNEPVAITCKCCRLPTRIPTVLREITESPACTACKSHGSDAHKRDEVHFTLWSEFAAAGDSRRKETIAGLKSELAAVVAENAVLREQVTSDYFAGISEPLIEKLRNDVLGDVERERDGAKDKEAEVLSIMILDIEPQHRGKAGSNSKCSCGKLTSECPEWDAIEPLRFQLQVWEKKQLANARLGKHHRLPNRHPEVRDESRLEFRGLHGSFATLHSKPYQPFGHGNGNWRP